MTFERIIKIRPAYDKRDPDPRKDYGIHGCDLVMVLKGDAGAVSFILFTKWYLPHVTNELAHRSTNSPENIKCLFTPLPAGLDYHSPYPMYENQSLSTNECEYLDGKPCYCDGSFLAADEVFEILLREGSDGVWAYLKNCYIRQFGMVEE